MTTSERIERLQCFGYTRREAHFLAIASLASGYFLRRQFRRFIGGAPGSEIDFIRKVTWMKHAIATNMRRGELLYHLCSKPLFSAVGQGDNRNRRNHPPATEKQRLIALDYVIEHHDYELLLTEEEKRSCFSDEYRIPPQDLPSRTYPSRDGNQSTVRYFVEKFPVLRRPDTGTLALTYIDEGQHTMDGFTTFMRQYRGIFQRLESFRLVYVAAFPVNFRTARNIFARHVSTARLTEPDPETTRMITFLKAKQEWDRGNIAAFDQPKLIQFRADQAHFSGEIHAELYDMFCAKGEVEVLRKLQPEAPMTASFETVLMPHSYALFGIPAIRSVSGRASGTGGGA